MSKKPGVMIYFELRPVLERMSDRNAGILFRAIMEYGETGKEPVIPDALLLIWPLVRMRLDTDHMRYEQTTIDGKYGAHCRWSKEQGLEPLSKDAWLAQQIQNGNLPLS